MAQRNDLDKPRKGVAILGSTGSIGRNALDVVRRSPERFKVVTLAAGRNTALLKEQIEEFHPSFVSVLTESAAEDLKVDAPDTRIGFGTDGASMAASYPGVEIAVSAIVGAAGLVPTLAAIRAGKDVALANKETLVVGGALVMKEVKKRGVKILPVDSEHSAVLQSIQGHRKEDIKRIILTASGGPFLGLPREKLDSVTPEQALRHPTWSMGKRITIDSATLMNKGFEVIEACWLFDIPPDKVSVCIHPQSIVHSMVEYIDGSIVAQMGSSDMRVPIAYALSYPERMETEARPFDIAGKRLEFIEPDPRKFPCLALAYRAAEHGGSYPCVLNAADEVAVDMFLKGVIKFTEIYSTVEGVLERHSPVSLDTVDRILEVDRWAREEARSIVKRRSKS